MFLRCFICCVFLFTLTACEKIALFSAQKKKPIASTSQLSIKAEQNFWNTLHQGNYQKIPEADRLLTAAYLENPNDPVIAAHLGFLHIWKMTERGREKTVSPIIVNEIILAKKYFKDSLTLNPEDARIRGFLGDCRLIEGKIFHDERQQIRGYFTLKQAIHDWPQFNYFTAGYVMSTLPADSKQFREGLEWQWLTLDLCAGEKIDRTNPNYSAYMKLETHEGPQRACWNSWIAPYNFEGFFLNMGDMLVKAGDWQAAIKIYNNAKLAANYASWPYKPLLEKRVAQAEQNVKYFQKDTVGDSMRTVLLNSGYGCVACHQRY